MRISVMLALVGAICLPLLHAAPAQAQASRTWVSGVGDDANPCSRTAPCKTLAGAISKTATSGEINCLDPGGFGALTITKSIAIICESGEAGVLVSGTNGITVNTPPGSVVMLRGLDFEGLGTGLVGINFIQGGTLHVEQCIIRGFNGGSGFGIAFSPTSASKLFVSDTYIADNGSSGTSAGIEINPGSGGSAAVVLNRVESNNNNGAGFRADGTGASSSPAIKASIVGSSFSGNNNSGIAVTTAGSNTVNVAISGTTSSNNGSNGVNSQATNAVVEIGSSVISGNTTGLNATGGGQVLSTGNNQVGGNTTPSSGSIGSAPVL